MNVIAYTEDYADAVKDLLVELHAYISSIDREGYNRMTEGFREACFQETMEEVSKSQGKILLAEVDGEIAGLVIGVICEAEESFGFSVPRRGRVLELIVTEQYRSAGIGTQLLEAMEDCLRDAGCQGVLLGVFGYNKAAQAFYAKRGYFTRMLDVMKHL